MPTAFVTGGSGFIGGALVRRLVAEGWTVRALARSGASADKVKALGADPQPGDLGDVPALTAAAASADTAFHLAAHLGEWGSEADFMRGNVEGTEHVLAATRDAGVSRFVHVGTEAALMAGRPLVQVDEHAPLRTDSPALYSRTKAMAEEAVLKAAREGFATVVVRPRLVWGPGDTTIRPALADAVKAGKFAWIGGGHHLTETTHVDNVVEGLMLAAARGAGGRSYFVTDGSPIAFREFVTRLLATAGVEPGDRSIPVPVARAVAAAGEALWRTTRRPGAPPLTRLALWLSSQECTIDITRARDELGYAPVISREDGLSALAAGTATVG